MSAAQKPQRKTQALVICVAFRLYCRLPERPSSEDVTCDSLNPAAKRSLFVTLYSGLNTITIITIMMIIIVIIRNNL